jgi:ferredoxin
MQIYHPCDDGSRIGRIGRKGSKSVQSRIRRRLRDWWQKFDPTHHTREGQQHLVLMMTLCTAVPSTTTTFSNLDCVVGQAILLVMLQEEATSSQTLFCLTKKEHKQRYAKHMIVRYLSWLLPAAGVLTGLHCPNAFAFLTSSVPSCRSSSTLSSLQMFQNTMDTELVDRNIYNIPADRIAQEWTAEVVPGSSLREAGVYLGAKSPKELMVDTISVELKRRQGEGLGLQLLEIAGGREDGLGITVIDGIVEGGIADGSDVMVGDSIVAITVVKKTSSSGASSMSEQEVRESVETECLGYDKTVEAILGLPPVESDNETIILTLKRLRRKPKVTVKLQYPPSQGEPDVTLELFAGENLRRAMLTRGVKLNDPLSRRFDSGGTGDCGGEATCSTCVVSVVEGAELFNPQKMQEQQMLVKNPRWRLACKAIVGYGDREGSMTVRVNPRQWDDYQKSEKTSLQ